MTLIPADKIISIRPIDQGLSSQKSMISEIITHGLPPISQKNLDNVPFIGTQNLNKTNELASATSWSSENGIIPQNTNETKPNFIWYIIGLIALIFLLKK